MGLNLEYSLKQIQTAMLNAARIDMLNYYIEGGENKYVHPSDRDYKDGLIKVFKDQAMSSARDCLTAMTMENPEVSK